MQPKRAMRALAFCFFGRLRPSADAFSMGSNGVESGRMESKPGGRGRGRASGHRVIGPSESPKPLNHRAHGGARRKFEDREKAEFEVDLGRIRAGSGRVRAGLDRVRAGSASGDRAIGKALTPLTTEGTEKHGGNLKIEKSRIRTGFGQNSSGIWAEFELDWAEFERDLVRI
jgi:hypothetical protein